MDFKHVLINRYEMLCIFCFFDNNSNKKVFIFVIKENLLSIMNRICNLFKIKYPIIQGGMVWCSGWRLAAAGHGTYSSLGLKRFYSNYFGFGPDSLRNLCRQWS